MIEIYTDGSCDMTRNSRGGYAVIVTSNDRLLYKHRAGYRKTTNNRMELLGLLTAFQLLKTDYKNIDAKVFSDSTYAINAITKWFVDWKLREKLDNKKNVDLIRPCYYAFQDVKRLVKVSWIKSHNGHRWNDLADTEAKLASYHTEFIDFEYEETEHKQLNLQLE